ncbi:hypothetical protein FSS13T_12860 [Flavobacterium saliperosum S13]|uniref:Uncharacterized protein n=2 Tax=Flavobacterium saliperosum TaxID=329186 RepID=A0A1G4VD60_9FLAO|nr:DUF1456 family protein [Flavobacterium saliperosum]ESU26004.1 hypothetical protein FSS13T_12860 [Flavobacterium saliperosum S13]SCX04921.1 Protein of unknown function [Flavobacterium saliperosum]
MTNNDIFKKLRVALQLRDDQIVEILELVDFRISKGEVGNFFRNEEHEKYMECGDQVLRNFLNALVIHLRGTKENPKNPMEVIKSHKADAPKMDSEKGKGTEREKGKGISDKPKFSNDRPKSAGDKPKSKTDFKKPMSKGKGKPAPKKEPIVEKVRFNNGKKKDNK